MTTEQPMTRVTESSPNSSYLELATDFGDVKVDMLRDRSGDLILTLRVHYGHQSTLYLPPSAARLLASEIQRLFGEPDPRPAIITDADAEDIYPFDHRRGCPVCHRIVGGPHAAECSL